MRSMLMLLGVLLHAASPYRIGTTWLVRDPGTSAVFGWIITTVHFFRMPAFFVVAGYFAMLSLHRRTSWAFLRERWQRLLIPCGVVLVAINLPQSLWLIRANPNEAALPGALVRWWMEGRIVGHLWFLVILAVYCLVLAAAGPLARRLAAAPVTDPQSRLAATLLSGGAACAALVLAVIGALAPASFHQYVGGLLEPAEAAEYLPYFLVGLALYGRTTLLRHFSRLSGLDWAISTVAILILVLLPEATPLEKAARVVGHAWLTCQAIRSCFWLFERLASAPSRTWRYLSEASYSVYVLHHVIVVMAARLLVPAPIGTTIKFLIVGIVAALGSLAVHHLLVLRSPLLQLALNGRTRATVAP